MSFTYKSEKEVAELSEYQREKYFDQKREFEASQAKEAAEKAATEKAKEVIESAKADMDAKLADAKKAQDEANAAKESELNDKIEKLEAKLQRLGVADRAEREKTMQELIMAKFSTEEGEQLIKDFVSGAKKAFTAEVDVEKAIFSTPAGSVPADFRAISSPSYQRVHARNVISVFPTMSNLITYLRLTPDPDADGIQITSEGSLKGEIEYDSEVVELAIKKIAGFLNVTEESVEDVPGFRAWIASELPKAYLLAEDMYIFKHDTDGVFTLAEDWVGQGTVDAGSNAWDKVISGLTQVRLANGYPNAIWVSPIGRQELLINKDDENDYSYPVVLGNDNVLRVDGVPVYSSNSFEGGEFLVGDFSTDGVTLHQRQSMVVRYSDEHAENFTSNLLTFLIEGRVGVAVRKTYNFVKGDLLEETT